MGEYFFCNYLRGIVFGNVIFKTFFANSCLVLKVCKILICRVL